MFVTILIVSSRKPGITAEKFRHYYEEYVSLIRDLTGPVFPICHRRTYIAESTMSAPTGATSMPAPGSQSHSHGHGQSNSQGEGHSQNKSRNESDNRSENRSDSLNRNRHPFDYDVLAELTFENQQVFEQFIAKLREPAIAKKMHSTADEFMEWTASSLGSVHEVMETRRLPDGFTRWDDLSDLEAG
ncbi:uncharacterized protein DSM5745_07577 [Aspergillus mulundensis]|uniref:EthD domain-containing protein n=1 Tax=Aspergillus mulundensis TaxID=1810919 RepID=A0A3D8REC1_9EURO|nr:hypothetical protein DSM5745_07577 [Aspergillus mulundensis]RDW72405.1 hypothetical protein DSM5745_07577 [Aspergillus mulundensis]